MSENIVSKIDTGNTEEKISRSNSNGARKHPAKVYSAQTVLLKAKIIEIEVDISKGLHSFSIVGLPDKAVEESKDRISAAIKNSGFKSPKSKNEKIIMSLAPADLKKEGSFFDLPMALCYLSASGDIKFDPCDKIFLGELTLSGEARKIKGVLPIVMEAKKREFKEIYLPEENVKEASLIAGIDIIAVKNLLDVIKHLKNESVLPKHKRVLTSEIDESENLLDFADIKGQEMAKRGLLIAAAGGHNAAMYGPPGTGKTMLAKAFIGILPSLSFDEVLEVNSIHSVSGNLKEKIITNPPLRSPHHTSSYVAMVGGGNYPKPGEITLAHRGVLFLDELAEFERRVIDALRQPLEDRVVSISRARGSAIFPANFILIAALNPCPCGNFGGSKVCICSPSDINRYHKKVSGPVMDRIDMWLEVSKVDYKALSEESPQKSESKKLLESVSNARALQRKRFKGLNFNLNSEISSKNISKFANMTDEARSALENSAERLDLSGRSFHKIIKLGRTIADIEGSERVEKDHVMEALQYRPKDMISL